MMPRFWATSLLFLIAAATMLAQVEAPPSPKVKLYMPYKEYSQEDNKKILAMFEDEWLTSRTGWMWSAWPTLGS